MASTAAPAKLDMGDPNVRRVVYNMYRGMLGTYNDKANDIVDSVPRSHVSEDAGIYNQLQAMINSAQTGPPPPPPPPGAISGRRLQSEIPERSSEPPAAIQNAMMKDKKPFTYTPGGLDLSEIKSPRMARRVSRNAQAQELHGQHAPQHHLAPTGPPVAAANQMPTQVFPTGPPPPPPPPTNNMGPPAPPPQLPPQVSPQNLPKIRGFDPNEILSRPSRLQAGVHTGPAPKQLVNEPGLGYGPSAGPKSQLGTIYIPPVPSQENHAPSPAGSYSSVSSSPYNTPSTPGVEQRKGPTPWVSQRSAESPTQGLPEKPQQASGGGRIIPIQIEGREPTPQQQQQQKQPQQYQPPQSPQQYQPPQSPQHYQPPQSPQYQQQQQQSNQQPQSPQQYQPPQQQHYQQPPQKQEYQQPPQQQQYQQPQQRQFQQQPAGTRMIPIQIEGAPAPPPPQQQRPGYLQQNQQRQYNQQSPTPYSPPMADGNGTQRLAEAARPKSQDQTDRGSFLPPLGPAQEYGAYNTAGVPLSALRKMQLSEEDKSLMEKLKTQVDDEQYLHRETDPRYRGAAIPSRAFRMLQTMTDTAGEMPPVSRGPQRGPSRQTPNQQSPVQDMGPGVPASEQQVQEPRIYTGGSIPSRSFRMLQAMTGQDQPARGRASPSSPSGRETPVGRWCPSPSPDPYWGYYPPDPYAYYNYLSDLNAAYGYPPPPPPPQNFIPPPQNYPPSFHPQRYANYASDSEENGYSSTDELGQYYQNYRRSMGYPPFIEPPINQQNETTKSKPAPTPQPEKLRERLEPVDSEEEISDESVSSSEEEEEETDTDDTEIEEKEHKKHKKSSHKVNKLKSVSDVNLYTSESTATVTNDEWEDCDSKIGDDDQEGSEEESNSDDQEEKDETEEEEEGDEEEEEETASEESEEDEEDDEEPLIIPPVVPEEIIPHQLSIIFEESECGSDIASLRRAASMKSGTKSVTSDTESTATLDNCIDEVDEEYESDEDNLMSQSSVTVRLPLQLKFSKNSKEEVTTVIVGDSQFKTEDVDATEEGSSDDDEFIEAEGEQAENEQIFEESAPEALLEELKVEDTTEEYKSDDADVSFTFSIPTRSNSIITVVSTGEERKISVDAIQEEEEKVETEVTVNVCLPKKTIDDSDNGKTEDEAEEIDFWSSINNDETNTQKTDSKEVEQESHVAEEPVFEENINENKKSDSPVTYEKSVNKLEDMISNILETTQEISHNKENKKLSKKDSKDSVEESEEDDSGVTDMSNKPHNSETDGDESEFTELNKMSQCQRANTHSRLFQLLQDECEKDDDDDDADDNSKSEPITSPVHLDQDSITARKEKLSLPLSQTASEVESHSSSSGVTSPSSPTVTDRLVKELIQSLLHKKKGKKFRKLPMAKLHAAALRILQEDMDPYDTSSASASGDDGFTMSPVRKIHSQAPEMPQPIPYETLPDNIYGENYYEYLDYYNTWRHPPGPGYYPPPPSDYDVMPSRAFQYLNHPANYSPGYKPKCPRVPPQLPGYAMPMRAPTPTSPYYRHYEEPPDVPLSFSDKRERVAKVFEKTDN